MNHIHRKDSTPMTNKIKNLNKKKNKVMEGRRGHIDGLGNTPSVTQSLTAVWNKNDITNA